MKLFIRALNKYFTTWLLKMRNEIDEINWEFAFIISTRNFPLDLTNSFRTLNMQNIWLSSGFKLQFDCLQVLLFNCSDSCHIRSLAGDSQSQAFCFRNFYMSAFARIKRVSRDALRDDTRTQLRASCLLWKLRRKVFDCFEVFTERASYPSATAVLLLALTGNLFQLESFGRHS